MTEALTISTIPGLADLAAAEWDACAGSANPFVSYAFLSALEDSGSVGKGTGWQPLHLVLRLGRDLIGCAPLYVKQHSYGEYVFDHGWAQACARAGIEYYPKLQCAIPFTPVPGPRLMLRPDAPAAALATFAGAMIDVARRLEVSSLHVTFPEHDTWAALGEAGFLQRIGTQFHWTNENYRSFDDFLARFASRKRKQVRKERREAMEGGLAIRTLRGREITRAEWDAFYRFYQSTVDRKWGSAYLTRRFFDLLADRLDERVVLVLADLEGRPVGGALNLRGENTLYGRNWGADVELKFLHFEACYYRAIDYAIAEGLARVEAGAQGTHKIQRGYLPVETYSAHWFRDRRLAQAVAGFLDREREEVRAEIAELMTLSPFRQTDE